MLSNFRLALLLGLAVALLLMNAGDLYLSWHARRRRP